MKKTLQNTLLMALVVLLCSACTKEKIQNVSKTELENTVQTGTWRITQFIDSGVDETDHFAGFSFEFEDSGVLSATDGNATHEGTWSVTEEDDDSPSDIDFNILFAAPADFAELSEDWHVDHRTDVRLELSHVSGGNGDTDTLIMERF